MSEKFEKEKIKDTVLFCFSGTGNSLNVALKIQEKIDNCKIVSISKAFFEEDFEYEASRIGFIFPVYYLDIPQIVEDFIKKIKILGSPYIFVVATCGEYVGSSFKTIKRILTKQDRMVHAMFKLVMPSNSIVLVDHSESVEENMKKIKDCELEMNQIIESIENLENIHFEKEKEPLSNTIQCRMGKVFMYRLINDRTYKVDEDKCSLCGTCVRVCPMKNIEIIDGKVTWNHNCECCTACLHWCPQTAIQNIGTRGKLRYHHPEISRKILCSYN